MNRTLRRALPVLIVPVLFAGAAGPAGAVVVDPFAAGIELTTDAKLDPSGTLTVTATGSFRGGLFENTTVALHVAGAEWYGNSSGQHVRPLHASPVSITFANTNTVTATFRLQPGSTLSLSYSAEVAGLAPSMFSGQCTGEIVRFLGGSLGVVKTC